MKKIIMIIGLLFVLMINCVDSKTMEYEFEAKTIELSLGSFGDIINRNYRFNLKEGDTWKCDEGVKYIESSNVLINYRSDVKTCIILSESKKIGGEY